MQAASLKIVESGLWNVHYINAKPLASHQLTRLAELALTTGK